jgi:hypothetical protein
VTLPEEDQGASKCKERPMGFGSKLLSFCAKYFVEAAPQLACEKLLEISGVDDLHGRVF